MYKDYTNLNKREPDFIINVADVELSCSGCPTIYDFTDTEGTEYIFYLRDGYARIGCHDNGETLVSGEMHGFDGVCSWHNIEVWAEKKGLALL